MDIIKTFLEYVGQLDRPGAHNMWWYAERFGLIFDWMVFVSMALMYRTVKIVIFIIGILTIPIWILPYMIVREIVRVIKKRRRRDESVKY